MNRLQFLEPNQLELIAHEASDLQLTTSDIQRALGFVSTPAALVDFMVQLAKPEGQEPSKVLEPACGDARFLSSFARHYGTYHHLVGVEINEATIAWAKHTLPDYIQLIHADFLLWNTHERFDIVIGNPPYGIVGDASHYPIHLLKERKAEYKQSFTTWKGKYNLYGAFIEKAVLLLRPGGRLVFVVPTTWLILDDFALLRRFLAERGRLEVFYVGRVFPKVNVSVVILRFTLNDRGLSLYDMSGGTWESCTGDSLIHRHLHVKDPNYFGGLIRFATNEWTAFEESGVPLGKLMHIRFAARSPEFRKSGLIRTAPQAGDVPVLTGRNLSAGHIDYETCYSGWWMRREDAPNLRSFYGVPHLVVGHTKGTRLVCAVDWQCYPWREEYHLLPLEGVRVDWLALERYLNSERIQEYLQAVYRDFTPHLTKAMLEVVPVPSGVFLDSRTNLFGGGLI
ncbi:Modification methylase TaqI [bacterium HR15]|nr:Modification methylase TaqI [bacterium HR15]